MNKKDEILLRNAQLAEKKKELRKVLYEEEHRDEILDEIRRSKIKKPLFVYFLVSLLFVLSLGFSIYLIYDAPNRVDEVLWLLNASFIMLISINFVIGLPRLLYKNKSFFIALSFIFFLLAIGFNVLYWFKIVKLPVQASLPDFTNSSFYEVIEFADKHNISYDDTYEYSDNVLRNNVINQSVKPRTLLKNVKNISFSVSNGPDYGKSLILPDMSGLKTEEVIDFVSKNHLNNVDIVFEENFEVENDIILRQNVSGEIKRSDKVVFTASLGDKSKLKSVKLSNLKGKSLLFATTYFGKSAIPYELKYEFSSKVQKGMVISTSPSSGKVVTQSDKVIITISKGKKIVVPDFSSMSFKEIMKWISRNNLIINYSETYSDDVKKGAIISSSHNKGDVVSEDTLIKLVFSKGKLKMLEFNSLDEFVKWANVNQVKYEIKNEFSDSVPKDSIIGFSLEKGKPIEKDTNIVVTVSRGKAIKVPDFSGKAKSSIADTCNNLGISCVFEYVVSDKTPDTAISQSIGAGTEIASGDSVTIEIAQKKSSAKTSSTPKTQNNSSNTNNNNSNVVPTNPQPDPPVDTCTGKVYTVKGLNNVLNNCNSFSDCSSKITSYFNQNYNGVIININDDGGSSGASSGSFISGISNGSSVECGKSYTIVLAK